MLISPQPPMRLSDDVAVNDMELADYNSAVNTARSEMIAKIAASCEQ
jgi:hypothetical protein